MSKRSLFKVSSLVNILDLVVNLVETMTPTDLQLFEKVIADTRKAVEPATSVPGLVKKKNTILARVSDHDIQTAIQSGKQAILVRGSAPASELPFFAYLCSADGQVFARAVIKTITLTVDPTDEDLALANMSREEFDAKSNGKALYLWRFSRLCVYNKPKDIKAISPMTIVPRNWSFVKKAA